MSIPELVGAVVAVLTVLGGAVRWLLQWVLARLEAQQDRYLAAQRESEERWLIRDRELQDELRAERRERLTDHRQHSSELREVIAEFADLAQSIKSHRPPPPSSP